MPVSVLGLELTQLTMARGTTALLGALSTTMGLRAILTPSSYAQTFGLPPSSTYAQDSNPFISAAGASRLAAGVALLACLYGGENRAVGLMMLTGSVVAVVDGIALGKEVGRLRKEGRGRADELEGAESKVWGHLGFGPVTAALGVWLLYVI